MQDYADKVSDGLKALGCVRYCWGVDIPENAVSIEVSEDSMPLAQASLELVADNPDIKVNLEIGSPLIFESGTSLVGGDKLGVAEGSITLAATGTYKGHDAFLTCGHTLNAGDDVYYKSTRDSIGKIEMSKGNSPGQVSYGDYSIGRLNSNFSPSHKVQAGPSSTILWKGALTSTLEKGQHVKKYGARSGYAYLTVEEIDISAEYDLGYGIIKGLIIASFKEGSTKSGDSGGPYWTDDLKFCGVHCGSLNDGRAAFTPYSLIRPGGFKVYADHDGSWGNYSSSQHRKFCSLCDKNIYESHSLGSWRNYNSASHSAFCSVCESTVYSPHSGSWSDYNSTYHKKYCSICKSTIYEPHSAYYNNALGKCTRCGRTGNITNVINPKPSLTPAYKASNYTP